MLNMIERLDFLSFSLLTEAVLWLVVATTLASAFHYVYFWFIRSTDVTEPVSYTHLPLPTKRIV